MLPVNWVSGNFPDLSNVASLGQGGQKSVYSCDHATEGGVVLKILRPHSNQDILDREIIAVDQVQSPRVPRIHETGRIATPYGESFWIREQRIDGQTLRDRINIALLTPDEILRFGSQMLEALLVAETARIVHRDVKPDNIIVDSSGNFWLLDFGIARHLTMASLTADTTIFGKFTLGYAPLEQIHNVKDEIDSRADLFALGVTIVESTTGVNPFTYGAVSNAEVLTRMSTVSLPRLNVPLKDSNGFADLVEAMTRRRRDQRCQSVQEAWTWVCEIVTKEAAR